jgi:hypothetical protein
MAAVAAAEAAEVAAQVIAGILYELTRIAEVAATHVGDLAHINGQIDAGHLLDHFLGHIRHLCHKGVTKMLQVLQLCCRLLV